MGTATTQATIFWDTVDTVLVDMDGTLLDLAFDNFFWLDLVPRTYAARHGFAESRAREDLMRVYRELEGTLAWYCIDHWTERLEIDLRALKREHRHRIRYLPGALEFLAGVRSRNKRLLLVTNAHRAVLEVKVEQTGLDREVDAMISSHDFEAPKESSEFWRQLDAAVELDSERTLLVEDSISVLQAARGYGVRHTVAVRRPDTNGPAREIEEFPSVDGVHALT